MSEFKNIHIVCPTCLSHATLKDRCHSCLGTGDLFKTAQPMLQEYIIKRHEELVALRGKLSKAECDANFWRREAKQIRTRWTYGEIPWRTVTAENADD